MTANPNRIGPPLGWPLLPRPDAHGELHFPSLADSVRENLRVLLSTRPGEQLMRPTYGVGLADFLHTPNTVATRRQIHERVTDGIRQWEARIDLDRVDVTPLDSRPGVVRVEIHYRLRRSGLPQRLGVQLDLEPAAGS